MKINPTVSAQTQQQNEKQRQYIFDNLDKARKFIDDGHARNPFQGMVEQRLKDEKEENDKNKN